MKFSKLSADEADDEEKKSITDEIKYTSLKGTDHGN